MQKKPNNTLLPVLISRIICKIELNMKRQFSIGIMLTTWMVGLFLVLLFPPDTNKPDDTHRKSFFQPSEGQISESFSLPDTSSFEFEWKLSVQTGIFKWVSETHLAQTLANSLKGYCSVPLFDVKTTFFYFFHTW